MNDYLQMKHMALASVFSALIAAGAFISIPVGPVPIVLQNMFVLIAGVLLGPRWGLASVAVYLLAGAVGLPVFAGGTAGIARFVGPTGGYLVGYLPTVVLVGMISHRQRTSWIWDASAMVVGSLVVYACGVPWLKHVLGFDWQKALAVGMLPFLIGDALKIVAAMAIVRTLRPIVHPNTDAIPESRVSDAS